MKNYFFFAFFIALNLFPANMFATERVDMLLQQTTFGTIVRNMGKNNSIICDQTGGATHSPSFISYVIGSLGNTPSLHLSGVDTVFDFEIYNGVVYFCGVKSNLTGGYGVIGYFSLSGFPATYVNYMNVPLFRRVTRLEVDDMAGSTHIVAIGAGIQGAAEMLDAVDLGGTWNMNFFDAEDHNYRFVDLAITDTFVVVAATHRGDLFSDLRALYFKKPLSAGATFSVTVVPWIQVANLMGGVVSMESCEKNAFVVAMNDGANLIGTTGFIIAAYDGMTHLSTNYLLEQYGRVLLRDLVYDPQLKVLEIALNILYNNTARSVIYNLNPAMATGTYTAQGRFYDDFSITSLDLSSFKYHIVATGVRASSLDFIRHFHFDYLLWDACFERCENVVKKINPPEQDGKAKFGFVSYEQVPELKYESEKVVPVNNICE